VLPIHGQVARGYEAVRDAFAANFEQHGDVGAACCVYGGGDVLVDLWSGFADLAGGRLWEEDTIQIVFSATKGITAACVLALSERGALDLDAPVATYWPEFARNGKAGIPLRWVLCHRAGLAAVDGDLTLADVLAWDPVVQAIAAQAPNWPPGRGHGYHARSFGWILGEVVRRVTGRSIGAFVREEFARPLGLDFWIGLPASELPRCARVLPPEEPLSLGALLGETALTTRVMSGPSGLFAYDETWNRPELLRAEMPSSNGVGNARALARFYAALIRSVDGVRLLAPQTVAAAGVAQAAGPDRVIFIETRYGLGFTLQPTLAPGAGPRSFGHPGAGGSLGFADPDAGLALGYVTTRMRFDATGDPRTRALISALYRAHGARR
jgi:CubicO group peptidase (beta-lactamase class C family)